ncbi:putative toxin-antitoxin system toxin component, PIN family [Candidatus Dojkabacteria bacterium]|uniref:Putative toxin-antitoxin system toxin component, PIN family n=1 Tax=Candidatus Dojkabacteria bacterium TaxID=2099670 RepID=A0A5C7J7J7_9BACT|nr:MAG: putative toxin-antitoxin system toxin component, PIN family [Candidatus Dojkabacteria bacterium]
MRIVLDANIYISSELSPSGLCGKVMNLFIQLDSPFELILTEKIFAEVSEVFLRPRVMKIIKKNEMEIRLAMEYFRNLGTFVPDIPISSTECRDPKDTIYLAAADAARADLVVSFDKDLLELKEYKDIKIVQPHEFIYIANQI